MATSNLDIIVGLKDKASKGVKQVEASLGKLQKTTKESIKPIDKINDTLLGITKLGAPLLAFGYAAKKAFDFGKEGAQLEFVRGKFEALAQSIGTTGDALLVDLRNATRGTRSDMELMASTTDFLALGLAKDREEAIRLTRVAGALNMNMNQLVLTLTNMTTMRFDALGVSVDGFDKKVKELEKTGLDTNKAFTEAFLQQAETQIEKVGDVADTAAGDIMRMEASVQNLKDSWKELLALPTANLAVSIDFIIAGHKKIDQAYQEHREQVEGTAESYEDYAKELLRSAVVAGKVGDENADAIYQIVTANETWDEATRTALTGMGLFFEDIGLITQAEFEQILATRQLTQANQAARLEMNYFGETALLAGAGVDKLSWAEQNAIETDARLSAQMETTRQTWGMLLDVMDKDIGSPIGSFIEDLEWLMAGGAKISVAFDAIKQGLLSGEISPEEAKPMLEGLFVAAQDLSTDLGNVDLTQAATNISEQLGVPLREAKDMITGTDGIEGALASVDATLTTLNVDPMQLENALGYADDLKARQGEIGATNTKVSIDSGQVVTGNTRLDLMDSKLNRMDGRHVKVYIDVVGDVPGGQHGLDMVVPPGFPNDTFPVLASSGERVTIDPHPGSGSNQAVASNNISIPINATVNNDMDLERMAHRVAEVIQRRRR